MSTARSAIELMDLPDEILLQILSSINVKTLVSVGKVNRRLSGISQDAALPLNKHVYYDNKVLLAEVFRNYAVNLSWLVKGKTSVIKESGLTPMGWYLLQDAANVAIYEAVYDVTAMHHGRASSGNSWNIAMSAARDYGACNSAWYSVMGTIRNADYISNHPWHADWHSDWESNKNAPWRNACCAGRDAVSECVTADHVKDYLLKLNLTDPIEIGKHSQQIAECLMIRYINKDLCNELHSIIKEHGLDDITFKLPADTLLDNPWIQQYHDLFITVTSF